MEPTCPLRPGELCHLCVPGTTSPKDCGLVYLVLSDPALRAELEERHRAYEQDVAAQ